MNHRNQKAFIMLAILVFMLYIVADCTKNFLSIPIAPDSTNITEPKAKGSEELLFSAVKFTLGLQNMAWA